MKRSRIVLSLLAAVFMAVCLSACGNRAEDGAETAGTDTQPDENLTSVTISCAGDCTLGSDESFSGDTFEEVLSRNNGSYSYFFENVKPVFESDDVTIVNLEGTLSNNGEREPKTFAFRGAPDYVNILRDGSVEAVTLANNHSSDYGEVSLSDTKETLSGAGIKYAADREIARLDVRGVRVAVVGLYQLDGSADKIIDSVMAQTADDDLVIVEVHWGEEGSGTPSEEQISLAHRAVDLGADLVIGHHPHVLQGVEKYKGKYICYSLGNFCFGGNTDPSDKDTMIFQQTFTFREGMAGNTDDYRIIPCSISSESSYNNYQPTPLSGNEKERVQNKIRRLSENLGDGNLDLKFD